ncbi:translational GTPase TypA [Sodalis-like secondary symbiont of Drepanosiphum platanoidis]|uniref:translational GTPase TypA n=1 Tax=Sodalis-like secondary symbiont of Drepanosiphum platanoidis TaxID=2994493 RepID=UPI003463F671
MKKNIRNIAIIAHVDHGKTTLVEKLLKQSYKFNNFNNIKEEKMDFNDLEKERGITIFSKNVSIFWKKYKINIIDTPGHSDFGGEVERVMSMVDSVLLLVDATDGPMPQTRFVTKKAFAYGLNPIVIINKIDRTNARSEWVIDKIFDLFIELQANDNQLDFPIIYSNALKGEAGSDINFIRKDLNIIFDYIIKYVKPKKSDINKLFKMQISQLNYDNYLGIIGIGRIKQGSVKVNQIVSVINNEGYIYNGKINKILGQHGLKRIEINKAKAGDIVSLVGLEKLKISDTICDISCSKALPNLTVEAPTVSIFLGVNTSPFCGKEGKYITSRHILNRLYKECMYNVALRVEETNDSDTFLVSGRGELHLSVLIETMRREGFEMSISRPKVICKNIDGIEKEPFEEVILDIKKKYQGFIMDSMNNRKGIINDIIEYDNKEIRLNYIVPSRGLIGFRSEYLTITSGTGIFCSSFSHYDFLPNKTIVSRKNGVLISNKSGKSLSYSLYNLQNRGRLLIGHGVEVYEGQIIGIHNRSNDLTVNCLAGKKLTNMRASGTDEATTLISITKMSLEQALDFINDDELIEITPKSIRLRKKYLKENERKRVINR